MGQAASQPRRPTIYAVLKMVGRRSLRELVPPYESAKSQGLAAPAMLHITIEHEGGLNAVVSGLFLDAVE